MREALCWAAAAIAVVCVWAAPAGAGEVTPDGRAMAESFLMPFSPTDVDERSDVYTWNRGVFSLASPSSGTHIYGATENAISDDGERVIFTSHESLDSADTDTSADVYETAGGVTSLLSTGPADAGEETDVYFGGTSADATYVYFETAAALVSTDTDGGERDIYLRRAGTTTLVSAGPAGSGGGHHSVVAVSRNGLRVVDLTAERMGSEDTDSEVDLYEYFDGSTKLVSKGPAADSSPDGVMPLSPATPDAKSIVVITKERFVAADDNEDYDLYQFSRGRTRLVTSRSDGTTPECPRPLLEKLGIQGSTSRRPPCEPFFGGQTNDGSKVLFGSPKPLDSPAGTLLQPSEDTTGGLFVKSSDGTTTLIDEHGRGSDSRIAPDGSRYVVSTTARHSAADTDDQFDFYSLEGGAFSLLTSGGEGHVGHQAIEFTDDLRSMFLSTSDPLVPEDTNDYENVYVTTPSGPQLALTGPADPDPAGIGAFIGASASGDRWFLFTTRPLVAEDTDGTYDVYIRHLDGTTRMLSP